MVGGATKGTLVEDGRKSHRLGGRTDRGTARTKSHNFAVIASSSQFRRMGSHVDERVEDERDDDGTGSGGGFLIRTSSVVCHSVCFRRLAGWCWSSFDGDVSLGTEPLPSHADDMLRELVSGDASQLEWSRG